MLKQRYSRVLLAALAVGVASLGFSGCTTTTPEGQPKTMAERHANVDSRADDALKRLYEVSSDARSAVAKAKGVLIFPKVLSGGFIVGIERGDGVLRVNGKTDGYYTTAGGSIGLQAGVQSRATIILFMTQEALDDFRNSDDWTVGAGATVAIANVGANGSIDSNTLSKPVIAFVTTNAGLAAGVSLKGTKISKMADE